MEPIMHDKLQPGRLFPDFAGKVAKRAALRREKRAGYKKRERERFLKSDKAKKMKKKGWKP